MSKKGPISKATSALPPWRRSLLMKGAAAVMTVKDICEPAKMTITAMKRRCLKAVMKSFMTPRDGSLGFGSAGLKSVGLA